MSKEEETLDKQPAVSSRALMQYIFIAPVLTIGMQAILLKIFLIHESEVEDRTEL